MWPSNAAIPIIAFVAYTAFIGYCMDRYGPTARAYAGIVAAQAEKNGRLTQQAKDDDASHAAETAEWARQEAAYREAIKNLKLCPQTQADVDALNARIGDD